jgi:TRAP-type C4-dicarboxylate transport system permease small subunit
MSRAVAILDQLIGWIAAAALAICFVLLTFNVGARYLAPALQPNWVFEICVFLLVWAILLGVARIERRAQHIRVDFLYNMFGPKAQIIAETFALIIGVIVALFFIYSGWHVVQDAMLWDERTESTLRMPFWLFYLSLSVAFLVHLIFIIDRLIRLLRTGESAKTLKTL